MNVLVVDYFNKIQVIKCSAGHEFPFSMHETLKNYKMKCPDCLDNDVINKCDIVISSEEVRGKMRAIEQSNMFKTSFNEFIILDYLKTTLKAATTSKISNSLDKSELTIKQTLNKLQERGLAQIDINASRVLKKDYYFITDKGLTFVNRILDLIEKSYQEMQRKIPKVV